MAGEAHALVGEQKEILESHITQRVDGIANPKKGRRRVLQPQILTQIQSVSNLIG